MASSSQDDPPAPAAAADHGETHGLDDPLLEYWQRDDRLRSLEQQLRDLLEEGAPLLTRLAQVAAAHHDAHVHHLLTERWSATERRLLEESARHVQQYHERLQREWEAIRNRSDEALRGIELDRAALMGKHAKAVAAAEQAALQAEMRLDAFERTISSQMAEASREFRDSASLLRAAAATAVVDPRASVAVAREPDGPFSTAPTWLARAAPLLSLAGLLVVIGLGVYVTSRLNAAGRRAESAEQAAIEARQLAERQTKTAQAATADVAATAARVERTLGVLAAADLRRFRLMGQRSAPGAAGQVLWSPSRGIVLTTSQLPAPPSGQTYQVWLVTTQGSRSLGLLEPDDEGRVVALFEPPLDAAQTLVGFMLTLEPTSGNAAPTGPVSLAS